MKKKKENQKTLPTGWREVRLGEVCTLEYGKPLKEQDRKDGRHPVFGSNGIVGYHDEYLITGPFIIVGRKGSAGMVQYSIGDGFPIDTTFYVKAEERQICLLFLYYLLLELNLKKWGLQSGVPGLNRNDVHKMKIPFPPLPEQKAIASLLETWDTAIEKTEALIAAKEKRFKWLLKRLISDQQNNPEWRKVKLEDLCTKILGGGTPSTANIDYWKGHIPWMTSADIVNAKTINTRKYITAQAVTDSTTNLIPRNNIIVVTRVGIGKAVKNEMDICISQDSQGLILKKSISADFLIHCLLEKIKVFKSVSQGSTIQGITKKRLSDIEFPLPSLPEQKQIARHINIVEREIGLLKELIEKYHAQKRGLMQKLLTGKWQLLPSFPRKRESRNLS